MSYSWGDDSSVSSGSGGYTYKSARKAYDPNRGYAKTTPGNNTSDSSKNKKRIKSPFGINPKAYPDVPFEITTKSPNPMIIALDITGSMGSWPIILAKKLPLLYDEAARYLAGLEISFAAVGDADGGGTRYDEYYYRTTTTEPDEHPLQIREFTKGKDLEEKILSITRKASGGNNGYESYELAAMFYATRCFMPNTQRKPLLFFTGDDKFCDITKTSNVQRIVTPLYSGCNISSIEVFKTLKELYTPYFIQRDRGFKRDKEIRDQWKSAIGQDNVILLKDPNRFVDCIIGKVAEYVDKFDDFAQRISQRQTPEQVRQVYQSLRIKY